MADFGELLEKLGRNAGLSALERMQLRTKGRDLEALGPAMSVLFGPGEADPHFNNFFAVEGEFETLPHPMAALYHAAADNDVGSGTSFGVLSVTDNNATWSLGLAIDQTNSRINLTGVPIGAVVEFSLWAEFEASATGTRALRWTELTGGSSVNVYEFAPDATVPTWLHITHKRRIAFTDTQYQLQVWQDAGEARQVQAYIVCERVR